MGASQPIAASLLLQFLLATLTVGVCLGQTRPVLSAAIGSSQAVCASASSGDRKQAPVGNCQIIDVAIQPDGVLRGRILDAQGGIPDEARAGLAIRFLREEHLAGRSHTDRLGRFAVGNLSGGVYQVVLERPYAPESHFCRVWSSGGAPPQASSELALALEPVVVRGRSALWLAWPPSLTATALTAGAIAGPVIYYNAHQDNRVPASP